MISNKNLYLAFLLMLGLFVPVIAQESGYKQVDVKLDGGKMTEAMSDVGNIEVNFCEKPGQKAVAYDVQPGEEKKVCYVVSNYSDQDLDVHLGFVDGTFTNDQRKNKACKQQGETTVFGQYVTGYADVVHIPAHGEMQYFASVQFPKNFTGTHNGCLVYYLGGVEMGGGVNFTVLMRRAKFIDVNITESDNRGESVASKEHFLRILIAIIVIVGVFKKKISIKKTTRK